MILKHDEFKHDVKRDVEVRIHQGVKAVSEEVFQEGMAKGRNFIDLIQDVIDEGSKSPTTWPRRCPGCIRNNRACWTSYSAEEEGSTQIAIALGRHTGESAGQGGKKI